MVLVTGDTSKPNRKQHLPTRQDSSWCLFGSHEINALHEANPNPWYGHEHRIRQWKLGSLLENHWEIAHSLPTLVRASDLDMIKWHSFKGNKWSQKFNGKHVETPCGYFVYVYIDCKEVGMGVKYSSYNLSMCQQKRQCTLLRRMLLLSMTCQIMHAEIVSDPNGQKKH